MTNNTQVKNASFWQDPDKRGIVFQVVVLLGIGLLAYYIVHNTLTNLERQNIASGFGFLGKESSFEIGESLISYSAADTYGKALLVGALNTLKVSFIGVALTIFIGTFVGIARLSKNWLVAKLAGGYIEVMQNIPVLLQLFFWYAIFYESLPSPRHSLEPMRGVFLSNRGLFMPVPEAYPVHKYMLIGFLLAVAVTWGINRWAGKRRDETGRPFPTFWVGLGLIIGIPAVTWLMGGAPTAMDVPALKGFNFQGGMSLSPEFTALLLGLVIYTAAFVAEIVRAGIQSVSHGQVEAAMSIGLKPGQVLRLVILPQALRVIIPPLTSQMLNLIKNSSLAVAIGYPDFVSVANTTINQSGQAMEGVLLIMACYLTFSLLTSLFMNWYNKRVALIER